MEKPIIGILGNTYKTQPGLFSSAERMYVNSDYIEGVLNNGGIPMAIPAVAMKADPEGILAVCDGILVPGGEDLKSVVLWRRAKTADSNHPSGDRRGMVCTWTGSKRDGNAYAWHLQRNSVFKCPVRW